MSTRSQYIVKGSKQDPDTFLLYRHCDGYPTVALQEIKDIFKKVKSSWEAARCGKVAAQIIKHAEGTFEPTNYFHSDIEWLYVIEVEGELHLGSKPRWRVDVRNPSNWDVNVPEGASVEDIAKLLMKHSTRITRGYIERLNPKKIEEQARAVDA